MLINIGFFSGSVDNVLLLIGSFVLLLGGAEVFTNGVEWLGHRLGVSESATGSILAAIGTALPETLIPVIAIIQGIRTGNHESASEVGVGAILGAPFMLATIAMFLVGLSTVFFSERRQQGSKFAVDTTSTKRDLSFFLVGYTLAVLAALFRSTLLSYVIGGGLIVLYLFYVYRSLQSGALVQEEGLDDLHLGALIENGEEPFSDFGVSSKDHSGDPATGLVILQTLIALGIIIVGAQFFVTEIEWAANAVGMPQAILALLLAPLATELPEKFNSVIWISEGKDTLALGNITGAMAFQGTIPVTLGILFTRWNLSLQWGTVDFLNGMSAVLAIVSGLILHFRVRAANDETLGSRPFLIGGAFYVLFLLVTLYHIFYLDLSSIGGH